MVLFKTPDISGSFHGKFPAVDLNGDGMGRPVGFCRNRKFFAGIPLPGGDIHLDDIHRGRPDLNTPSFGAPP
jgi:hypothetical protein